MAMWGDSDSHVNRPNWLEVGQIKKVNVSINGDTLRVSSKSKNDLQLVIKLLGDLEESLNIPLKACNYR